MPEWGEIFADPDMQDLAPNPEVTALLPEFHNRGLERVLDAGCGAGRHLGPLVREGFRVVGVDREASVWPAVRSKTGNCPRPPHLVQADLAHLPFRPGCFDLIVSINVINHGDTRAFQAYCREFRRVLRAGGHLFIIVSPREFGELVRRPDTVELEPGTLVHIATPDGTLVHHFPTPEELAEQFPAYRRLRLETVRTAIPFMGGAKLPQLIFWAVK
ncbi:MAG: class I SAM-dependent methyltransferase [Deltaproteobacteria bacterium]|nr:class I SAM-dependent methyltransferase [Deltaproteobacteria bacterium]